MDKAEAHILAHLNSRGLGPVVHEPDGNIPPDFLVGQHIAVEVRRLIQHEDGSADVHGLSEVAIPLRRKVRTILAAAGSRTGNVSWFVGLKFQRPVPAWNSLGPQIEAWLAQEKQTGGIAPRTRNFGGGFELNLFPASTGHDQHFILGMVSDWDSGGMVLSELKQNLELCVAEKTVKVSPYRQKYAEWWLVLTDHIGLGQDPDDRTEFRKLVERPPEWDKIVIVDAGDANVFVEF